MYFFHFSPLLSPRPFLRFLEVSKTQKVHRPHLRLVLRQSRVTATILSVSGFRPIAASGCFPRARVALLWWEVPPVALEEPSSSTNRKSGPSAAGQQRPAVALSATLLPLRKSPLRATVRPTGLDSGMGGPRVAQNAHVSRTASTLERCSLFGCGDIVAHDGTRDV